MFYPVPHKQQLLRLSRNPVSQQALQRVQRARLRVQRLYYGFYNELTTSSTASTSIPVWAYAGTTIALIIGVIVGFLARKK